MKEFIEYPASNKSISFRRPVHKVGINDANYLIHYEIDGKSIKCPFYTRWITLIERCYSSKYHLKHPTYKDCSVTEEWVRFLGFKKWMKEQDWKDKHLDKDILIPGNKFYSPDTCVFIPRSLNTLLLDCGQSRGVYEQGVHFDKNKKRFIAQCSVYGYKKYLGNFITEKEASMAYKEFKSNHIKTVAEDYRDNPRLYKSILMHSQLI